MLCTLILCARTNHGETLAQNFLHYFVSPGYPPERQETSRGLILRGFPGNWTDSNWSGPSSSDPQKARAEDACYGLGHGFFEWRLPVTREELARARSLKVLCEASSHRSDAAQTDCNLSPTTLELRLNEVSLYRATLRNHPHDSRGVLSYLRGGVGPMAI